MTSRRKVSAALQSLRNEIGVLRRLDAQNQSRFYPGAGRPSVGRLSARQMSLLTESILARAFTSYERFLEEVFLLYCQGRPTLSGIVVGSYLAPRDSNHGREIVKSSMKYLEWNSPETVLERAEVFLHPGNPIHLAVSTNKTRLRYIRKIRNAIAHKSVEAEAQFRAVIQRELNVLPARKITPGEFLVMTDHTAVPAQTYLRSYLEVLEQTGVTAAG